MEQPGNNNLKKNREFGLLAGMVLILFAGSLYLKRSYINFYLVIPGFLFVFLGSLLPRSLTLLRKAWETTGLVLGKLNTFLILTIIYFILIVPIAWLLRLMRKDLLDRQIHRESGSYWLAKQSYTGDSMKYQF
jgi:Saxitoxin biosynthesis operon protein SxtJ